MSPVSNRKAGIASAVTVAVAASSLTFLAVQSKGETVHEADLNDGGVWVSSAADASFARLNKAAGQFDAGVKANTTSDSPLDVVQDGSAVAGISVASSQLIPIDTRTGRLDESAAVAVPAPSQATNLETFVPRTVDLRGGTVAMVDPKNGKVWAQRVDTRQGIAGLEGLSAAAKPVAQVGAVAAVAVDVRGGVHAVSGATGKVISLKATATGFEKPVTTTIKARTKAVDITAVGDRWVVYDPSRDEVFAQGLDQPVNGGVSVSSGEMAYAALQHPGPDSDDVALQDSGQVHVVGLDGGPGQGGVEITDEPAEQQAPMVSRPLRLGSCLHAAWAVPTKAYYNVNCGTEEPVPAVTIERVGASSLRDGVSLRTNRRLIVLNDLDGGDVWDLDSKPVKIDDWESLIPPPQRQEKNKKKNENLIDDASTAQPPKAEPDNLKARPSRRRR